MSKPTSILLFAAGLGTRMAPLTDTTAKPLIPVAGKPLLDHALACCGGLRVVVNVHYFAEQIERYITGSDILISDERGALLETGGGLKHALPVLGSDPVFTMNTDAVWCGENPIHRLSGTWQPQKMDALLLVIPKDSAVGHLGEGKYFDILPDGRLILGTQYVYTGVQIIRTDGLAEIKEDAFSMWALWNDMLARGSMYGVPYAGQWCDVGRPESIALAQSMLDAPDHV